MSALGAGLRSAGQNWNKPGLAAFAAGAGAAMGGGDEADDKLYKRKLDAIDRAIKARQEGDLTAFRNATLDFHKAQLEEQRRHSQAIEGISQQNADTNADYRSGLLDARRSQVAP